MRYNNAEEMIKNEVPLNFRTSLVPIIKAGFEVYEELKIQRPDLFVSNFISNVKGWLISYLIFRQFELDIVDKKHNYVCKPIKVNNFNYHALLLTNGNININLAKVHSKGELPSPSKYRLRLARNNDFQAYQLKFNLDSKHKITKIENVSYLALLTYGGRNTLDFVELVVPTKDLKDICYIRDLLNEYNFISKNKKEQEVKIQKVKPKLKEEIIRELEIRTT